MAIKIVSDSSCDLSHDIVEKHKISIIPYLVSYGDDKYFKDFYDLSYKDFYNTLMTTKCKPRTAMPSINDYLTCFEDHAKNGDDILCICLTSKFSGSFNCANMAAKQTMEKYPSIKIEVIDSQTTCMMQGMLVLEAVKLAADGSDLSSIAQRINKMKLNTGAAVTVDTLVYLQRGGRIGKVSSIAGDLLNIKPIIRVADGELIPDSKVRTRKRALDKIVETVLDMTEHLQRDHLKYFLLHTEAYSEALELGEKLSFKTGYNFNNDIPHYLGVTIGAHIGPSVVGIGYFSDEK